MKNKYLKWICCILVLCALGTIVILLGNKSKNDDSEENSEIADVSLEEADEAQEDFQENSSESSEQSQISETVSGGDGATEGEELFVEDNSPSSTEDNEPSATEDNVSSSTEESSAQEWSRDY